ncbi:RNA-directed DNA polymerase [Collinsella sp. BA40]|uniref:reverse transcriptase domain-containing protein n=1 Tax=Collinsella sp. BA40 TaxID=2560852 RepID=UPI0011CB7E0F|nr:reverse transcriptase domain-containing protein [Collinsella sp. BA40]TXF37556.1 RNA-directed DNA polymerase [Collinsella sp. BA40]
MSIVEEIASDLGFSKSYIKEIAEGAGGRYRKVLLNGRRIDVPSSDLKLVQGWIACLLQECMPCDAGYITAYEPGRSVISNALLHSENAHLITLDITGFFRSCTTEMVKSVFSQLRFVSHGSNNKTAVSKKDIELLTQLSCYRGSLPMGSPCSPGIANRIMVPVDQEIIRVLPPDCSYSRYSDDIAISSSQWLDIQGIVGLLEVVLAEYGFNVNHKKVHCYGKGDARKITGIYIHPDGTLGIGKSRKALLSRSLYLLLTRQTGSASELLGHLNFCKQVDPDLFVRLIAKYSSYGVAVEYGGVMPALVEMANREG